MSLLPDNEFLPQTGKVVQFPVVARCNFHDPAWAAQRKREMAWQHARAIGGPAWPEISVVRRAYDVGAQLADHGIVEVSP